VTYHVSRRSLLALGAGLGATAMMGGSALARAPKVGTQSPYFHRFNLGAAEVTVVSDGPLPLGDPSSTFLGVPKEEQGGGRNKPRKHRRGGFAPRTYRSYRRNRRCSRKAVVPQRAVLHRAK